MPSVRAKASLPNLNRCLWINKEENQCTDTQNLYRMNGFGNNTPKYP